LSQKLLLAGTREGYQQEVFALKAVSGSRPGLTHGVGSVQAAGLSFHQQQATVDERLEVLAPGSGIGDGDVEMWGELLDVVPDS
jgi:hypothetical protein